MRKLVLLLKASLVTLSSLLDMSPKIPDLGEVIINKSKDFLLLALKILMAGKEEMDLASESPANLLVDLDELGRQHKVNTVKTLMAQLIEAFASNADYFLTSLAVVPLCIVYRNLHLQNEDPVLSEHVQKFGLENLIVIGRDELEVLGLVCSSLMILTNISHVTPQRGDLM